MSTPLSIQLYTLREEAKKDFFGVLEMLAETGYKGVEFAGLHDKTATEVAAKLADLGLKTSSSHVGFPTSENIHELADTEKTLGNSLLISGFGPDDFKDSEALTQTIDRFQTAVALVKAEGLKFGIHNHWWEFTTIDGRLAYETLLEAVPDLFGELDVYWVAVGGLNVADLIARNAARLPLLHIKDGPGVQGQAHVAVGSGTLDFAPIVAAADPNVLEWLVVELDECDTDMTEAVKQSYKFLTESGLASGNK
ncbi:sugar phosphate isomerase [Capsulimonas corticalis]|uniref:Sugar phosphate isomerase n=1 Tax=Capsulimonas corticalis TaxID=2219043 RepID=A0A402CR68_9BACT|nr:sugar phosphate isomerase/epimerase [Capsulimonas corticalis]BDI34509.1 sugar phosphate isomerase [Capsulimonas corticalis]